MGQGMEGQDTGYGFRVTEGKIRWDIGKEYTCEGVRPWHRVPRAAGAAPGSLAVPKARLDIGA